MVAEIWRPSHVASPPEGEGWSVGRASGGVPSFCSLRPYLFNRAREIGAPQKRKPDSWDGLVLGAGPRSSPLSSIEQDEGARCQTHPVSGFPSWQEMQRTLQAWQGVIGTGGPSPPRCLREPS